MLQAAARSWFNDSYAFERGNEGLSKRFYGSKSERLGGEAYTLN